MTLVQLQQSLATYALLSNCIFAREGQVSETISALQLPDSWRELVIEYLSAREEIDAVEKERAKLEERMRRLKKQYRDLEIEEHEYKQELVLTQAQLASLAVPQGQQVVQLGDNVEGLVLAWETATKEERHQLLQMMLDAVYVDVAEKRVVGLQPKPSFLPLFNLEKPVRAGEMVLATDLTIGRGEWTRTNTFLPLLPSGIAVLGITKWVERLAGKVAV
ncbi:hypothetical protein ACFLX9_03605 [Chloroflexota bacterium]